MYRQTIIDRTPHIDLTLSNTNPSENQRWGQVIRMESSYCSQVTPVVLLFLKNPVRYISTVHNELNLFCDKEGLIISGPQFFTTTLYEFMYCELCLFCF